MSIRIATSVAALVIVGCGVTTAVKTDLRSATVRGVEIHYVDSGGEGEPLVFVHGSLADLREWEPVAAQLAADYRTVRYSRRYNHPNENTDSARGHGHSAAIEADDLAALIDALGLGSAHVAGASYGAYTALLLAVRHPERVRSLILVEPPLLRWLPDLPGGDEVFAAFHSGTWAPAAAAAAAGDDDEALRITMDFFAGPGGLDTLPPAAQQQLRANFPEWRALLLSRDAFPPVLRSQLAALELPVLLLSGADTYPIAQLVDPELERSLRQVERIVVPNATHQLCTEQPTVSATAIRRFLQGH